MVHQRQGLPLGLEPGNHRPGVHAQLDDFQRHTAAHRFLLLGHINHAAAAFADFLEQLVASDERARTFGDCTGDCGARLKRRDNLLQGCRIAFEEIIGVRGGAKQPLDAPAQLRIAVASQIEIRAQLLRIPEKSGGTEDRFFGWVCSVHNTIQELSLHSGVRSFRRKPDNPNAFSP